MNTVLVLDIETAPLPLFEIEPFKPEFEAAKNIKDPEKIKASIIEKENAWRSDLALSAVTGRVLCVGWSRDDEFHSIYGDDHEKLIIEDTLGLLANSLMASIPVVGFCSRTFDVPFLIRRAFRHGLKVPACFWENRYLASGFVDIAERWACGGREPRDRISLDTLSKFLGTGEKNGEGKDFAKLWVVDRVKALAYLENDLKLTKAAYERMYQ